VVSGEVQRPENKSCPPTINPSSPKLFVQTAFVFFFLSQRKPLHDFHCLHHFSFTTRRQHLAFSRRLKTHEHLDHHTSRLLQLSTARLSEHFPHSDYITQQNIASRQRESLKFPKRSPVDSCHNLDCMAPKLLNPSRLIPRESNMLFLPSQNRKSTWHATQQIDVQRATARLPNCLHLFSCTTRRQQLALSWQLKTQKHLDGHTATPHILHYTTCRLLHPFQLLHVKVPPHLFSAAGTPKHLKHRPVSSIWLHLCQFTCSEATIAAFLPNYQVPPNLNHQPRQIHTRSAERVR